MLPNPQASPPRFLNSLEPPGLIEHFLRHPPEGFEAVVSASGQPGFRAPFDVLTTIDAQTLQRVDALPMSGMLRRALTWPTLFWGTTVTEYAPVPPNLDGPHLVEALLASWGQSSRLMI